MGNNLRRGCKPKYNKNTINPEQHFDYKIDQVIIKESVNPTHIMNKEL